MPSVFRFFFFFLLLLFFFRLRSPSKRGTSPDYALRCVLCFFSVLSVFHFFFFFFCILYPVSCILYPVSCFLFPVSCILFPVSCFLFPVSCILFPVSCILFSLYSISIHINQRSSMNPALSTTFTSTDPAAGTFIIIYTYF